MKTAVEWLYEHILLTPLDIRSINKCLEQAKEMEREQIVKAYTDSLEFTPENISKGEQYYNENYNL
jgi:hypothetical protein